MAEKTIELLLPCRGHGAPAHVPLAYRSRRAVYLAGPLISVCAPLRVNFTPLRS